MLNLVIPAAGKGSRFDGYYKEPKPFIPIGEKVMIELAIESILKGYHSEVNVYICLQESHKNYESKLDSIKNKYNINITYLDYYTSGQAETVGVLLKEINNCYPIITANCDQVISWDINNFLSFCVINSLDGCIPVFKSNQNKWSYALIGNGGNVIRTEEKKVISEYATVGIYYWKDRNIIMNSIEAMFNCNDTTNNETYLCPAYNYLIKNSGSVKIWEEIIMHGVGTPEDLSEYLKV